MKLLATGARWESEIRLLVRSAMTAVFSGMEPEMVTGRGADYPEMV